jgi:hypothetical protein
LTFGKCASYTAYAPYPGSFALPPGDIYY